MTKAILASVAMVALAACGRGKEDLAADSTGRNLQLAQSDTGAAMNDRPTTTPPAPAPRPAPPPPPAPRPAPPPAAPRVHTGTLAIGSQVSATLNQTLTSRSNKAGEVVMMTVASDVKDSKGRVVIPSGSPVELTITEIEPAKSSSAADGKLTLAVSAVTVRGQRYALAADVTSLTHTLKGRGVTAGEAEKVAVGTAAGAILGRVIGGNKKGTIIGGVIGAAGGTVVAAKTASRDVVVTAGDTVGITLTGPLTVTLD
ncbi:MAG: glycine zipper 2TM domain-containing protein [Gemmatimonadota bacterium]